jgi:NAD+ kinase
MELHRVYIVANTAKKGSLRALAVLKAWCQGKGIEAIPIDLQKPAFREVEGALVVALGGDGTVLRAASIFAGSVIPILGANTGSLGFLTQVSATSLTAVLEGILRGQFSIEERMRLAFVCGDVRGTALNDLVFLSVSPRRFCELELLWSEGVVATYPGDGLIIATPTGSTAYNLSVGGPVVVPPAANILVSPMAVHRLGLRPLIFPADEILRVRTHTAASLFGDGDFLLDLAPLAEVTIERAALPTRLVRVLNAPAFFSLLEGKLNWGGNEQRRNGD